MQAGSTKRGQAQNLAVGKSAPRRYYVHLDSGRIVEVTGVTHHEVTDSEVVFHRGTEPDVSFDRRDVFFTCNNQNLPPA